MAVCIIFAILFWSEILILPHDAHHLAFPLLVNGNLKSAFVDTGSLDACARDTSSMRVWVMYNCFIYPKHPNWLSAFENRLMDLAHTGLPQRPLTTVNICVSSMHPADPWIIHTVFKSIQRFLPGAQIDVTLENRFEYPCLSLAWRLSRSLSALEANKTVILYYHAKGSVFSSNIPHVYHLLFRIVVQPWKLVLGLFDMHRDKVNKIGTAASTAGFFWFNFFWVRASYVQRLEAPRLYTHVDRRHYYESWLGRFPNKTWEQWHFQARRMHFGRPDLLEPFDETGVKFSSSSDCISLFVPMLPLGASFSCPLFDCFHGANFCQEAKAGKISHYAYAPNYPPPSMSNVSCAAIAQFPVMC